MLFKIEGGGPDCATGGATTGTTTGMSVHCANNVIAVVTPGAYGKTNALPPEEATNQPLNVYPLLVGGAMGADTVDPETKDPFATELPLWELKVTVYDISGVTAIVAVDESDSPTEFVAVTVNV